MTIETMDFPAGIPVGQQQIQTGMTLRDYFAGQVVGTIIAVRDFSHLNNDAKPAAWAVAAYIVADAMLAARKGADHGRD